MIETILGIITGIGGNIVQGIFNYKTQKLEIERDKLNNEHKIAMVKAETDAMVEEAKANIAITHAQVEGAVELADANISLQAQKEGNKNLFGQKWIDTLMNVEGKWKMITLPIASFIAVLFGFVDFLKGLIRPSLTIYLVGLSTWITYKAWEIMNIHGSAISNLEAVEIWKESTSIMIYLTVSAVTFWFGDRRMGKTLTAQRNDRIKPKTKITIPNYTEEEQ